MRACGMARAIWFASRAGIEGEDGMAGSRIGVQATDRRLRLAGKLMAGLVGTGTMAWEGVGEPLVDYDSIDVGNEGR